MNRKDVGLVLAVCLVAGLLYLFLGKEKAGDTVVITVDGREYGTFDLSEDRELMVQTEKGYNLVVIQDGTVFIQEADCPDHYCMRQGKLPGGNKSLICLPHKLVVEVKEKDGPTGDEPDAIVQ